MASMLPSALTAIALVSSNPRSNQSWPVSAPAGRYCTPSRTTVLVPGMKAAPSSLVTEEIGVGLAAVGRDHRGVGGSLVYPPPGPVQGSMVV